MTPTTPVNPAQRIDQTYEGGVLVRELVYNYPHNGGGTLRVESPGGGILSSPVSGLLPQRQTKSDAITLADLKEVV